MYSLFLKSGGKGAIFKPLFFEFYKDEETYSKKIIRDQFLLGSELLFIPILEKNTTEIIGYFPNGADWFNFLNGKIIMNEFDEDRLYLIENFIDDFVPIFIRGGSIIPFQNSKNIKSSLDLDSNYMLKIAPKIKKNFDLNIANEDILYYANGKIINFANLSNENLTYEFCIINNCLINIEIRIYLKIEILIKFKPFDIENSLNIKKLKKSNFIKSLQFYNLDLSKFKGIVTFFQSKEKPFKSNIIKKDYMTVIIFPNGIELGEEFQMKIV